MSSRKKQAAVNPNAGPTKELDAICNVLRGAVKFKTSTSYKKRVDYFKGKKLLRCMEELSEQGKLELSDEKERLKIATTLMHRGYFFAAKKNEKEDRLNKMIPGDKLAQFDPKHKYYIWTFDEQTTTNYILLAVIIIGFTAACMFPIWPHFAKVGLWYVSVTLLLFMLGFIFIRLTIFIIGWLIGWEFWIFPNMFDEELSVCDSFKPMYSLEASEAGQMWSRVLVGGLIVAFIAWVATQPTEFDKYIYVQKELIADLYSGALLSDRAQSDIDNMDTVKMPSVEDLEQMDEEGEDGGDGLDDIEMRTDPEDGKAYSLEDFVEEYGGSLEEPPAQWVNAPVADDPMDELDDIMNDVIDSDPLAKETTAR